MTIWWHDLSLGLQDCNLKMGRPPCCDKLNVRKGLFSAEEDAKTLAYGTGNMSTAVTKKSGNKRCGKSCRVKWNDNKNDNNYSRLDDEKKQNFTAQEEELIVRLHAAIGSRWSIIAQQLPGKTDNDVKIFWNTKLRKKLSDMGIDPVTHKPISQILADYGNISGISKPMINRVDFKNNAFLISTKPSTTSIMDYNQLNNDNNYDSSSMDLLDQLQAIKSVAEAYRSQQTQYCLNETNVYNNLSSSSSSSSSMVREKSPTKSFNWQDFLLEDVFVQADHEEEILKSGSLSMMNVMAAPQGSDINNIATMVPAGSSFVETMIDHENEMLMEFAEHLRPDDH
ncbi:hypothetical protein ACFE04_028522 [Oxalis oulophora]